MRVLVRKMALAFGLLLVSLGQAEAAWTRQQVIDSFDEVTTYDNGTCVLHDGWLITFLSHDGRRIGAVTIVEQKEKSHHDISLDTMLQRVTVAVGMRVPRSLFFLNDRKSALLMDRAILDSLSGKVEHVFEGSALEAMVYLQDRGYFEIQGIRENGSLTWKTVRKTGVGLRMPLSEGRLSAIEVTGKQEMDEHAASVLANKLGLGKNTALTLARSAAARQLSCKEVTYMNGRAGILVGRTAQRAAIGTRDGVEHMLRDRNYAAVPAPHSSSAWPEKQVEPPPSSAADKKQEPSAPRENKVETTPPLDPRAAREAYVDFIKTL